MPRIDLVTGFLGSGKTTFLKHYARYWMKQGKNIGLLENDHGAVNVDTLLLGDLEEEGADIEMVAGGCDLDCHRRRFKTKLIAMGMLGYDRVLVEPSGIYDVDEFFDALCEEPLDRWYQIGNVIAIVDANLEEKLSEEAEYLLAVQIADAGIVVMSHIDEADEEAVERTLAHMNRALEKVHSPRRYTREDVLTCSLDQLDDAVFAQIAKAGYHSEAREKKMVDRDNRFVSLYYMNASMSPDALREAAEKIMADKRCGDVFRIKGFVRDGDGYVQINATRESLHMDHQRVGQEVVIVIGEKLNQSAIDQYMGKTAGTL